MKEKNLNNHLSKHFSVIEKELTSFKKDKKPQRLHRLRVEIKKAKAILSFVSSMDKEKFSADELKPLFRAAGNIRATQVNIKLLRFLPGFPKELIGQLEKKERALTGVFVKNIHLYIKKLNETSKRLVLPAKLPRKKRVKKYFKKQFQKAEKKFSKEDREQMHIFRMKIKRLMYVYSALPKKLQDEIDLDKPGIDKLQEHTGNWHDTYSAVKFLSHQQLSKKAGRFILKLKEKEKKQFKNLLLQKPEFIRK